MDLKGYRLWVMGQLDSTCRAPPRAREVPLLLALVHAVAAQIEFESKRLETSFSLDRLKG
jgi:hypothetical protein